MKLNPSQNKAVQSIKGRILVLAGAGSGKTRVITHRIAHLIQDNKVAPSSLLAVTFTNKAAKEMRERVAYLIGREKSKKVTVCTFHSFCMRVLRCEIHRLGYTQNFSLYDERDMQRLCSQVMKDTLKTTEIPSAATTYAEISSSKNKSEKLGTETQEIASRLQEVMRTYNAVDFDALISLTIEIFEKYPDVLERHQEKFRFIMIDEYQDTNPTQFRLAELLAEKHRNLFVVGDDDQAIYGFRGADVQNILQFDADQTIKLEQNYRSTKNILSAANHVIEKNPDRQEKSLWTNTQENPIISVFHAPTDVDEAKGIADRLISLKEEHKLKWKDMAVLYRSNVLSRNIEMALLAGMWQKDGKWILGIPYEIFGGTEFAERSEIKDIFAFLRVIANPLDQEALLRIINVPRRGISDATLKKLTEFNRRKKLPLWTVLQKEMIFQDLTSRAQEGIRNFVDLIHSAKKRFAHPPLNDALKWFLDKVNYQRSIEQEAKTEKSQKNKLENVQECISALAQYEEEEPNSSLAHFVSSSILARQNEGKKEKQSRDRVQVMTFHSAKGLEFHTCFLVGLEDHLLPHEKSLSESGLEEERRIFYVALTRAKRNLIMSMARSRMRTGKAYPTNPSRFLFDIPKDLMKVTSWKTF